MFNVTTAFASPSFRRFMRKFKRFIKYDLVEMLAILTAAWVLTEAIRHFFF